MNGTAIAPPEAVGLLVAPGQIELRDRSGEAASCVAENNFYCPGWVIDNIDQFATPTAEHVKLVVISVTIGFAIAFGMALLSHSRGWLVPPMTAFTGILYTIPSLAAFFILIPITGRGADTAIIALTAYTLQIIYRNIVTGLNNVPEDVKAAGRGMGLTSRQLLWRVELPLAIPEIVAGVRVATVT
ncbi:MAG TPA: ABC transporter permease, partial [Solirubrobacterales bacterium]|nr:ABC transporter permease [Solirubrobacterales bacterium]